MLGSEEAVSQLAHNRVNQLKFIQAAGCSHLPGSFNLKIVRYGFIRESAIYQGLVDLIRGNPNIKRWAFKMNGEPNGRGIAYIGLVFFITDTKKIIIDNGDIFESVKSSLATYLVLVEFSIWRTWANFLIKFLDSGGIIEASADGEDGTPRDLQFPICHMMIMPNGEVQVLGSSSLILLHPFQVWGAIFPQQALPMADLVRESLKLAEHFYKCGFIGHLTCEYVYIKKVMVFFILERQVMVYINQTSFQ